MPNFSMYFGGVHVIKKTQECYLISPHHYRQNGDFTPYNKPASTDQAVTPLLSVSVAVARSQIRWMGSALSKAGHEKIL
jgi:hypothetical protein